MNNPEDTEWLSKESTDFLEEARIWPSLMMRFINIIGFLSTFGLLRSLVAQSHLGLLCSTLALAFAFYKGSLYCADIRLIRNELERRLSNSVEE